MQLTSDARAARSQSRRLLRRLRLLEELKETSREVATRTALSSEEEVEVEVEEVLLLPLLTYGE